MFNQKPLIRHLVPDNQRMDVADRIFGMGYALQLEPLVFRMAEALADDYDGPYWDFYTLSNGRFYMAPTALPRYTVRCDNGFAGSVEADAMGIIVMMYAYSALSFGAGKLAQVCANQYHLLRDYALDHHDVSTIMAAID